MYWIGLTYMRSRHVFEPQVAVLSMPCLPHCGLARAAHDHSRGLALRTPSPASTRPMHSRPLAAPRQPLHIANMDGALLQRRLF